MTFIDFVYNHQLIDLSHKEQILKSVDKVAYDQTLKNQFEDSNLDYETDLYHAQLLIDHKIMDLQEVSKNVEQFINFCYFDEQILNVGTNALDDSFLEGYQKIIEGTLNRLLRTTGDIESVEEIEFFERDNFVHQKLNDNSSEFHVLTGIYIDELTASQIADEYNEYISEKYHIPKLESTKETIDDFFKELLNNVNGGCTYKFDIDFGLELPEMSQSVFLEAPTIYRIKFRIKDYAVYFIIVLGEDYILC